jgi:hypothetical protein
VEQHSHDTRDAPRMKPFDAGTHCRSDRQRDEQQRDHDAHLPERERRRYHGDADCRENQRLPCGIHTAVTDCTAIRSRGRPVRPTRAPVPLNGSALRVVFALAREFPASLPAGLCALVRGLT